MRSVREVKRSAHAKQARKGKFRAFRKQKKKIFFERRTLPILKYENYTIKSSIRDSNCNKYF